MEPIRILIVDDHEIVRDGLRWMLEEQSDMIVVGEAKNGVQALESAKALQPDIVLMDIKMPIMDGVEVTRRLKESLPDTQVIIMTSFAEDALVLDAIRAGASGYLLKEATRDLVVHTISAVSSGGALIAAPLLRKAVDGPRRFARANDGCDDLIEPLTGREHKVLERLAKGQTNREIGNSLGYAEVTVKKHVQVIMNKLNATDRTQAAVTAMRLGIIE